MNKEITALKNQISQLKKQLAGTMPVWVSEKEVMELYGWSRTTCQQRRNEHPKGIAWICEGGNKVSSNKKTVRSNIRWNRSYIDKEIFGAAA